MFGFDSATISCSCLPVHMYYQEQIVRAQTNRTDGSELEKDLKEPTAQWRWEVGIRLLVSGVSEELSERSQHGVARPEAESQDPPKTIN